MNRGVREPPLPAVSSRVLPLLSSWRENPRLGQRSTNVPDRDRSATSLWMTDRGQCLFKRERAEVDQGLGKSKEIWPPLAIRSDEKFSPRGVTKEEGKMERLRHRLKRTAQRAFDHQAQLTRYRKFDFDQVATTAVDILRREHDPSHSCQGSGATHSTHGSTVV